MHQIDPRLAAIVDVHRVLDVDRVVIGGAERLEHVAHQGRELGAGDQAVEVEHLGHLVDPAVVFPQPTQRVAIGGHEEVPIGLDVEVAQLRERLGLLRVGRQFEHIDVALAVPGGITGVHLACRFVEGHQLRVVSDRPLDGPGAQAEDEAQHAGVRIDVGVPDVEVVRVADTGGVREEEAAVVVTADALHQDGHLLVGAVQAALATVLQSVGAHHRRVHGPHCVLESVQALLRGALVGAEDRLVLAGERVAEVVLQQ